jgi:predicted DNA-binding protein (UPF0251 family)
VSKKEATKTAVQDASLRLLQDYFAGKPPEQLIETFFSYLKHDHQLSEAELDALLRHAKAEHETLVPATLFADDKLAPLEAVTKYLHENKRLRFTDIGHLLNRDQRVIWTTYSHAKKKRPEALTPAATEHLIPARLIADRKRSVLETLALHLHDVQHLTFAQIARLLRRDDRTIWTVYNRARKKEAAV